MANIKSVEKDIYRSRKRNEANSKRRARLRTLYKNFIKSAEAGNVDEAREDYRKFTKAIDTAAGKGLVKKNNASRKKSRLAKRLAKITA